MNDYSETKLFFYYLIALDLKRRLMQYFNLFNFKLPMHSEVTQKFTVLLISISCP